MSSNKFKRDRFASLQGDFPNLVRTNQEYEKLLKTILATHNLKLIHSWVRNVLAIETEENSDE